MDNSEVLHGCSNIYLVGSQMYGLVTPESDEDYVQIYFDKADYVRPFPIYPDEQQTDNNNYKLYSLVKYATLLVKGNPNIVEIVNESPIIENCDTVTDFIEHVKGLVVHKGLVSAMLGHLNHISIEITRKGITPKRLSHSLRLAETAKYVMLNNVLVPYRELAEAREFSHGVKLGEIPLNEGEKRLIELMHEVTSMYNEVSGAMPDSSALRAAINVFFKELYDVS